ncbi:HXXEE domain-containing protein [Lonepinella sp. MS14437]|uniref:HXXEE domain-containing protein n=1 Tax=Lonepinella sp. MS14437 TaxID=3003620 RepID=UPI0036DA3142
MMNWYRHNWYYVGLMIFIALAFYLPLFGVQHLSHIQVILTLSWMAFLVHQFEEYGLPGGFPSIFNIVLQGNHGDDFNRYPTNANLVMIDNVFLAYPFYIIPIFFPDCIWLSLIQLGQAVAQYTNHGITSKKLGKLYNPGLGSIVFLHTPLLVYYICYVESQNLATASDYLIGFIGSFAALLVLWIIPILVLKDRNSPYPYREDRIWGYAKERVMEIKNGK